MAARPLVLPEPFTGEGSWDQWIAHFENVAAVNAWDDAAKLLWLRARLTKRAQTAYQKFTEEARASYEQSKTALQERFEPKCKRELYQAEFQTRRKQRTEGWADYAEDLKILVDKAFPDLQEDARDLLAMNHFLNQLDNPQVAFSVKQSRPRKLDEAVAATLEMESFARPKAARVAQIKQDDNPVSSVTKDSSDAIMSMMKQMMERVEKLEQNLSFGSSSRDRNTRRAPPTQEQKRSPPSTEVICRKCGRKGHYARGCAVRRPGNQQGNETPLQL